MSTSLFIQNQEIRYDSNWLNVMKLSSDYAVISYWLMTELECEMILLNNMCLRNKSLETESRSVVPRPGGIGKAGSVVGSEYEVSFRGDENFCH